MREVYLDDKYMHCEITQRYQKIKSHLLAIIRDRRPAGGETLERRPAGGETLERRLAGGQTSEGRLAAAETTEERLAGAETTEERLAGGQTLDWDITDPKPIDEGGLPG